MADVFGKVKRQREGQKLKAFGLSAVLAEQQLCTCNTLVYTLLGNVTKTVNNHGEQENEKWEQNLTSTLALSVNSFPILCLFPTFYFPVPLALVLCSPFPVLVTFQFAVIIRPRRETAKVYVYGGFEHMTAIFFSKLIYNSLEFNMYEYRPTFRNLNEMDPK